MRASQIVAILLLLGVGWHLTLNRMSIADGHDFYHYWAVSNGSTIASNESFLRLYSDNREFAAALNKHAAGTQDGRLQAAADRRRALDLTGTPLFYASFWLLPLEYDTGFWRYQYARMLVLLGTVLLLARLFSSDLLTGAMLALACWAGFVPLETDTQVGNVNVFQLGLHAAALACACRMKSALGAALLMAFGALLVFWKPTMIGFSVCLALVVWARLGTKSAGIAAAGGVLGAVAAFLLPALHFGTTGVWSDWFDFLPPMHGRYTVSMGNFAVPQVAQERLGIGTAIASVLMILLLLGSVIGAAWTAAKGDWWPHVRDAAKDARLMGAAGIVGTLASQPLVWEHYQTLSLLPALWLLWRPNPWRFDRSLAILAIAMTAGLPRWIGGDRDLEMWLTACGWIPLWVGVLMAVRGTRSTSDCARPHDPSA